VFTSLIPIAISRGKSRASWPGIGG
jgi:hypothetical protein